jgi:four helix bundle protein
MLLYTKNHLLFCKMNGPIYTKSKQLAVEGIRFCEFLKSTKQSELTKQLFRSVTSVGANVHEANDAESRGDFIHKLKIAQKELNESIYWVEIISEANEITPPERLMSLAEECRKLLGSIILTSKKNMESKN